MNQLRFGIVGPGAIAAVFAGSVAAAGVGRVTRVLGRSPERAAAFVARHGGRVVQDTAALLAREGDDAPDALYVATPHTLHGEYVAAALIARVPVLVEKPLTTEPRHTAALVEGARRHGVPLMEGWMYRAHPQLARLFELLAEGAIGAPREVHAEFAFDVPFDPDHRLFAPALGGSAIWDVGGYPLSFALGVARATAETGQDPLQEMELLEASGALAPGGVDVDARCVLGFGPVRAHLACATRRAGGMSARVVGERGELALEHPWLPEGERRGTRGVLRLSTDAGVERIEVDAPHDCFALEALELARLTATGEVSPRFPLVDHDETLAIARLLADWRAAVSDAAR